MALVIKKTGTDIPVDQDTTVEGLALSSLNQLIHVYYYIRLGLKVKISFHALVTTEPAIVAEAAAANRTVRQIIVNGSTLKTIIPAEDVSNLDLADCEKVKLMSEFSYTDGNGDKGKQSDDSEILQLLNSATGIV